MPSRKKLKHATVIGVFATRAEAEAALRDLRAAGFKDDHIGLVARNADGKLTDETGETYADEGAAVGAVAGAVGGSLVGLGVLAGVIPIVGPVLAIGTLGTVLLNAAGGAAIAGIAGALIGWGIPEEDAGFYESEVKAGRFLVTVDAGNRKAAAWEILRRHGGYDRAHATKTKAAGLVESRADEQTMELREERLKVRKTPVKKGDVEVRREVITEHKQIEVPVEREEVVIERRPARGRAARGDIKAEEIRIPVREERIEVTKETVVNEEVTVGKRKVRGTRTVTGDVKKERLKVEDKSRVGVRETTEVSGTRTRR